MSDSNTGIVTALSGLAIVVGLAGINFGLSSGFKKVSDRLDELKPNQRYELQVRDVVGNRNLPEKFYEIDGKRAYIEIDGKPVQEYIPK